MYDCFIVGGRGHGPGRGPQSTPLANNDAPLPPSLPPRKALRHTCPPTVTLRPKCFIRPNVIYKFKLVLHFDAGGRGRGRGRGRQITSPTTDHSMVAALGHPRKSHRYNSSVITTHTFAYYVMTACLLLFVLMSGGRGRGRGRQITSPTSDDSMVAAPEQPRKSCSCTHQ